MKHNTRATKCQQFKLICMNSMATNNIKILHLVSWYCYLEMES